MVAIFKSINLFDLNFWDKDSQSKYRSNIKLIHIEIKKNKGKIKFLEEKLSKESLKDNYYLKNKGLLRDFHYLIPSFARDIEKKRMEAEIIPDDFISDDEFKEISEFEVHEKKLSKRTSFNDNQTE